MSLNGLQSPKTKLQATGPLIKLVPISTNNLWSSIFTQDNSNQSLVLKYSQHMLLPCIVVLTKKSLGKLQRDVKSIGDPCTKEYKTKKKSVTTLYQFLFLFLFLVFCRQGIRDVHVCRSKTISGLGNLRETRGAIKDRLFGIHFKQ